MVNKCKVGYDVITIMIHNITSRYARVTQTEILAFKVLTTGITRVKFLTKHLNFIAKSPTKYILMQFINVINYEKVPTDCSVHTDLN